jgi:hypothetical protein
MARVGYAVRGRRSSAWISAPLWAWLLFAPLLLAVAFFAPMVRWTVKGYLWSLAWLFIGPWKIAKVAVKAARSSI